LAAIANVDELHADVQLTFAHTTVTRVWGDRATPSQRAPGTDGEAELMLCPLRQPPSFQPEGLNCCGHEGNINSFLSKPLLQFGK